MVVDSTAAGSMELASARAASTVRVVGMAGEGSDSLIEVGMATGGMAMAGIITVGTDTGTGTAVSRSRWAAGPIGAIPIIIRRTIPTGTIHMGVLRTDIIPTTAATGRPTLGHTTTFITTLRFTRTRLRRRTWGSSGVVA